MKLREGGEKRDKGTHQQDVLSQIVGEFTISIGLPPSPSQQWKQRNDQYKSEQGGPDDAKDYGARDGRNLSMNVYTRYDSTMRLAERREVASLAVMGQWFIHEARKTRCRKSFANFLAVPYRQWLDPTVVDVS